MFKPLIAAVAAAPLFAGAAFAGPYVNVEANASYPDSTDDTETELSGKIGASYAIADSTSVYGEIAGVTNEDSDGDDIIDFAGKIGVTYKF